MARGGGLAYFRVKVRVKVRLRAATPSGRGRTVESRMAGPGALEVGEDEDVNLSRVSREEADEASSRDDRK